MTLFAHAGHVLVDLLYALPLFIMVGLLRGRQAARAARARQARGLILDPVVCARTPGVSPRCDDSVTAPRRVLHASGVLRAPRRTWPTRPGARCRGADAYAVYRAAEDRADAAEQALAVAGTPVLAA